MSKLRAAIDAAKRQRAASLARPSDIGEDRSPEDDVVARSTDEEVHGQLDILSARRVTPDTATATANRNLTQDRTHRGESAYRMLRTRVMQKMRSNNWKILGVSSIAPDEGKTLTAINLAISIAAEMGQEAFLVDLDLRKPSIYRSMGIHESEFRSLSQYLQGTDHPLEDFLICPCIERLGCFLSSTPLERPSDVLASPRGKQLFDRLRSQTSDKSVVIVDLPPLLTVDDALAVAPMIDALLFVVAEGQTKRDDLAAARSLLDEFNVLGTLLNKSVETDHRSSYYY